MPGSGSARLNAHQHLAEFHGGAVVDQDFHHFAGGFRLKLVHELHRFKNADGLTHANPDVTLTGPLPPDTCWLSAGQAWNHGDDQLSPDGYLALYHDQGLIPVKLLAFDQAVNTSLGLPFLRTSPDHGTGFDIAGHGKARGASMLAAIRAAWELSDSANLLNQA